MRIITKDGKHYETFGTSNIIVKRINGEYFLSLYDTNKVVQDIPIGNVFQIENWRTS